MKPTISNAFNDGSIEPTNGSQPQQGRMNSRLPQNESSLPPEPAPRKRRRNPRQSLAASLAAMQADLRETNFGWSLDLSPMQAIDALQAMKLVGSNATDIHYLVSLEQSAWRDAENEMPIAEIAQRLTIPMINRIAIDQIVLDHTSLLQLVSLCQPSRLVVVAVDGEVDERDADAMTKAIEDGRSPLLAELRAIAAIEVLGDRSLVMHCRQKETALNMVADNFRHYLAALNNAAVTNFEAPEAWQIDRLLGITGMMTIRPLETQRFSTSIDVGINTTKERFSQPADKSLIYDIPSNTWHDEP